MNRVMFGAAAAALVAGIAGPAQADFTLTILHINDFHSRFQPITSSNSDCNAEDDAAGECFGGIARLKTAIDQQRAEREGENVVLLSAGDNFQGSLFYTQYKAEVVTTFFNQMGFDVVATGNHEFDDGPAELANLLEQAEFPIIGGNFDVSQEPELAGKINGVIVLNVGGERIGVIGATTVDTPEIASPGDGVVFQSVADYVTGAVGALEEAGINKIIVLSHIGYQQDQELAANVAGVDVVVGGHTHTLLSNSAEGAGGPYPTMVANPNGVDVPIVQAGQYGKYLGEVTVTWNDDGQVVSAEGEPVLVDASFTPDEAFTAKVAELSGPLEELRAEVIGDAAEAIDGERSSCRFRECEMGNLAADAQLDRVRDQGIQIAFQNGGGVRASIDAGEITMGEALTVFPFSNTLATFQISGADIRAALENGVSAIEDEGGRFPQVAGLKYTFDASQPVGSRIVGEVLVDEAGDGNFVPLDPAKTYGVVTNDYMRNGGDGYEMFAANAIDPYDFGPPLERVFADYIAKQGGSVTPYIDGRITDATPAAEEPAAEAPAEGGAMAPAEGGAMAPADGGAMAPADGGAMAPADGGAMAPADGGAMAPADGGAMAPADGGAMAPADGGAMAPAEGAAPATGG